MTEPLSEPTPGPTPVATPRVNPAIRGVRRVAIIAIIASLSLTAVLGIVVLLGGGSSTVQSNILATSALVAAFSTIALCHLAVLGRPVRVVGFVGLVLGGIALALGLNQIWGGWDFSGEAFRWLGITAIAAISLAHANLLLLLSNRRHPIVRVALAITLGAIAAVALLLILPIATQGEFPGDEYEAYSRWLGVTAIVDALGTIVTPILALFLRDAPAATSGSEHPGDPLEQRIAALAGETGLDREALLTAALDAFEASRPHPTAG